jgi:hypothetical protein
VIEKQDERILDARKIVFGLFSSLLTASSLFAAKDTTPKPLLWVGVHFSLLGLLVAGRFVEQQSLLLQAATASRAFVLELLTPVELTDTLSARFQGEWAQRTTYIYVTLGLVSTFVALFVSGATAWSMIAILGASIAYAALIWRIGRIDVTYARNGQDWSFSTTACAEGETVSILLTNLGDRAVCPLDPPAELVLVADEDGSAVHDPGVPLRLVPTILDAGRALPPRRACRWLWRPARAGLWSLKVFGEEGGLARRCILVRSRPPPQPLATTDRSLRLEIRAP